LVKNEWEEMAEKLDGSHWWHRRIVLLVAAVCVFAAVVYDMRMPAHNRGTMLGMFLTLALLYTPFTLKTAAGRLWWGTFVLALGSSVAAVVVGIHNPWSRCCAVVAGCAYSVGVCLRWYPPTARS
jgi:hypothetical protein